MIIVNALIALLSELGIYLCALIAIWMVDSKLGMITLGLYIIKWIALIMVKREQNAQMKNVFKLGEKL